MHTPKMLILDLTDQTATDPKGKQTKRQMEQKIDKRKGKKGDTPKIRQKKKQLDQIAIRTRGRQTRKPSDQKSNETETYQKEGIPKTDEAKRRQTKSQTDSKTGRAKIRQAKRQTNSVVARIFASTFFEPKTTALPWLRHC